jgi:hypothetical protein
MGWGGRKIFGRDRFSKGRVIKVGVIRGGFLEEDLNLRV